MKQSSERIRLLKILKGQTPDRVPWFADLGHWYKAEAGTQWDLFKVNCLTKGILDLHREVKAGWYIEPGSLHEEYYENEVERLREIKGNLAVECFKTPLGEINMIRRWNQISFSWDIVEHMVKTPDDLRILLFAVRSRNFKPVYENWEKIEQESMDVGLGFPSMGYTGLGSLMSYYMGVENTSYAIYDEPKLMEEYINAYNQKHLELVDLYCKSPAPHLFFGDNLSGDVQPPPIFRKYSFDHYANIANRVHKAGKTVSAHLDGMLNNIIGLVADTGIDVADACTPSPCGDLEPMEIRRQARNSMILFGGISPDKWLPQTGERDFILHVKEWLDLKEISEKLVLSAGDQVPPGTDLRRIKLVYELIEEFGKHSISY